MGESIYIHKRFCGPPDSGNGGYVCGLVAQYLDGVAEVRLHKPPPLEKHLDVIVSDASRILLKDGESIIAQCRPAGLDLEVPSPPSFDQALRASKNYICAEDHFFPTCFVCGPARGMKDGLRIFPGMVPDGDMVASAWVPDETLVDDANQVRPEFIWASLDCPGAFAVLGTTVKPIVLGSLTAEILKRPVLGQHCIATGWEISRQGRKRFAGTALFSESGDIIAKAQAIWIEIG
jgi:hypothetical protein